MISDIPSISVNQKPSLCLNIFINSKEKWFIHYSDFSPFHSIKDIFYAQIYTPNCNKVVIEKSKKAKSKKSNRN